MKITKSEFLHQIAFFPRLFPVNCYLVEEEDSLTLIDAALPYSAKAILAAATQIGKPITKIVLTHAHSDHIGALDKLHQALPECNIYISKRDARLMNGDISLDVGEHQTPIKGVPKNLKTHTTVLIQEGETIGSLISIASPGHTPGSMSFLDRRTGALITGDAFQTRGGIAVAGDIKPLFPFPALATWSKPTALTSAKKLLTYEPELLAPGHGPMLPHPVSAMSQAITTFEQKLL